jgi:hypothetical protein
MTLLAVEWISCILTVAIFHPSGMEKRACLEEFNFKNRKSSKGSFISLHFLFLLSKIKSFSASPFSAPEAQKIATVRMHELRVPLNASSLYLRVVDPLGVYDTLDFL